MNQSLLVNEWPTQQQDMQAAGEIIDKHRSYSDGEPLGLVEIVIDKSKPVPFQLRIPDWVAEIIAHFRDQYGQKQGQVIASKVITRFLLKNETIH